ncbi:TPA: phage major tail tube protein, partial [Stenotrophomonas maltophilia]
MSLPSKLKNLNLFNDGASYLGQVVEVKLPTLTRKMEEFRAGGMVGPIDIDLGQEKIELEWKCGGLMRDVLRQYGAVRHNAVQLRFAGAYQREDSAEVDSVEIVVRGRHTEIDAGT